MQIELTLTAPPGAEYQATDLGFLLHKHPDRLHTRDTAAGTASIFFSERSKSCSTAVLHLAVDPVGLVRGKSGKSGGLLTHYVNDRPYVANSFLSVALARCFGQSLAGKSKEKQGLADEALPFRARVVPVAAAGGMEVFEKLFAPLGYSVEAIPVDCDLSRSLYDLRLAATITLKQLLNHLYVLVPVIDNTKHYWIDRDEIDKLIDKGKGWLSGHPAKELIARRALKHRRALANIALQRLSETPGGAEADEDAPAPEPERDLEKPIRLHDLRLDAVTDILVARNVSTVLDLGCGEGRLMARLIKKPGFSKIVGIDASVTTIEKAARRLHLDRAGDALRERVSLRLGSLTYGDRGWRGFDAATLIEVIEHIDPPRLSSLELSVFGDAKPGTIIITTPNREYNLLFEGLPADKLRHPDHRFEWSRAEFADWAHRVAITNGYTFDISPLGPVDAKHGAPSQMAIFNRT